MAACVHREDGGQGPAITGRLHNSPFPALKCFIVELPALCPQNRRARLREGNVKLDRNGVKAGQADFSKARESILN